MASWFYLKDGQQVGPVTGAQLREYAARGALAPADLVWKEGQPEWVAASTVAGLFAGAGAAPAAVPVPAAPPEQNVPAAAPAPAAATSRGAVPPGQAPAHVPPAATTTTAAPSAEDGSSRRVRLAVIGSVAAFLLLAAIVTVLIVVVPALRAARERALRAPQAAQSSTATATPAATSSLTVSPEAIAESLESDEWEKQFSTLKGLRDGDLPRNAAIDPALRQRIHDDVVKIAKSEEGRRRHYGLSALAMVGVPADLPVLERLSDDKSTPDLAALGPRAGAAALRIDREAGMKLLESHASDRDWIDGVAYALREAGPQTEPELLAMLRSPLAPVRRAALIGLHEVGTRAAIAPIQDAEQHETASDDDLRTRYAWAVKGINERATEDAGSSGGQ